MFFFLLQVNGYVTMKYISKKKILLSHPTGNTNVRAWTKALHRQQLLESFHTSIACFQGTFLYRIGVGPLENFRRREFDKTLQAHTHTYPWKELGRMVFTKLGWKYLTKHESGPFCVDAVYHYLDACVARYIRNKHIQIDAVYAYEDGALQTFQAAKRYGKNCLYELPIGYWRAMRELLEEEQQTNPAWAMTLGGFQDSEAKLARKDHELALADRIFVASSFTKQTLQSFPGELSDIAVVPYGFPPVNLRRTYQPLKGRKMKLLFVGGLSQRKGISYLFEAIKGLESAVELTVVGSGSIDACPALKKALAVVRYIPSLPHVEILKLMATHDLLVFPSLFEGFGLVVTEAMSQGTPVITTERTCGPDIITSGKDGWIIPAGTAEPIRELLEILIARPEKLQQVGESARQTAAARPWRCYGEEMLSFTS